MVGWLCWGLTSQSTIFQSYRDGAIASWVINQYFRGVKCLAQGHNTAAVGLEPRTSRSGVRHSTTEPPRSPLSGVVFVNNSTCNYRFNSNKYPSLTKAPFPHFTGKKWPNDTQNGFRVYLPTFCLKNVNCSTPGVFIRIKIVSSSIIQHQYNNHLLHSHQKLTFTSAPATVLGQGDAKNGTFKGMAGSFGQTCSRGTLSLNVPISGFWNFRDFLAVLFTFLRELQLWFVNLQPKIKVMLILALVLVQANSVL